MLWILNLVRMSIHILLSKNDQYDFTMTEAANKIVKLYNVYLIHLAFLFIQFEFSWMWYQTLKSISAGLKVFWQWFSNFVNGHFHSKHWRQSIITTSSSFLELILRNLDTKVLNYHLVFLINAGLLKIFYKWYGGIWIPKFWITTSSFS